MQTIDRMVYFRYACAIEMGDHVIVTGGDMVDGTDKVVSVYDEGGWLEDWPPLNTGRGSHGCGHYVNSYSKEVT